MPCSRPTAIAAILAMLGSPMTTAADACTSFRVTAKDGAILVGRSMEFGMPLDSAVMIAPRGLTLSSTGPGGKPGLEWKVKHGFVAANFLGIDAASDGLNEAGLSVGALLLPGFAQYQQAGPDDASRAVGQGYLASWLLSSFATVAEVKEALPGIVVFDDPVKGVSFPLHWAVYDAAGGSVVIEYVGGELRVHDNPVGVLTNSPPFDWQMTNLRNYVSLTRLNVGPLDLGGYEVEPIGQGTGLLGLPGDYTPPHRFVRTVALAYAALPAKDAVAGANLAFHLLNTVDIPLGAVAAAGGDAKPDAQASGDLTFDYTQWVTVRDLTNRVFYFRTYDDLAVRKVDLAKLDLAASAIRHIPMSGGAGVADVTASAR